MTKRKAHQLKGDTIRCNVTAQNSKKATEQSHNNCKAQQLTYWELLAVTRLIDRATAGDAWPGGPEEDPAWHAAQLRSARRKLLGLRQQAA